VPPGGLYLNRIWYDGVVGEMMGAGVEMECK